MPRRRSFPLSLLLLAAGVLAPLVGGPVAGGAPTASPTASPGPATAERGETYEARLDRAIEQLVVARERRAGYDRDEFRHWVDADSDGCDTRDEVLVAEARRDPEVGDGCALSGGRWRSPYDGATWTETGDLDVDHLVPLAEAWDSGARRWGDAARERFANDLRDPRSLVAVTDEVNASKGDQDVREWLPELRPCRYLGWWVAVKHRWRLRADAAEVRAMRTQAEDCGNPVVTVVRAR